MVKSTSLPDANIADDHPNTIAITYEPVSGTISGFSTPVTTVSGIKSLSDLKILSASTAGYKFTFTSSGLANGELSSAAVTTSISSIQISNTETNYNIYTNLAINFAVLGDDGKNYPETCTVDITSDSTDGSVVLGQITSVEWPAVSSFTVSKTSPGTVIYTLTTGSITDTLTIIYDPPQLKVTITPNVIFI